MRKGTILTALALFGALGLVGWATLGSAQPVFDPPIKDIDLKDGPKSRTPVLPAPRGGERPSAEPIVPPLLVNPATTPKLNEPAPLIVPPVLNDPVGLPKVEPTRIPPRQVEPSPIRLPEPMPDREGLRIPTATDLPARVSTEPLNSKSEPAVTLEWVGPPALRLGMPTDYTLVVRNTCSLPLQKVAVQMRTPSGVRMMQTDPKAEAVDGIMVWELGTLTARQERRIVIGMQAPQRGEVACQAWVTFTAPSLVKLPVREPKLHVKLQASERVLMGDPANVVVAVSNPGDHPAERVRLLVSLDDGLETARGGKQEFNVGTLGAGETRTITIPCQSRAGGRKKCEALAEGEGGLKAEEAVVINVIEPRLDLAVAGPKMRYEGKKAAYSLKVTNPGDAPAANVFVSHIVPTGFKFVQADSGGQYDEATRCIKWFVGDLAATDSREVRYELLAVAQGEFMQKTVVNAARGMKAEQEFKTVVEGISAVLLELVDTEDPVEVGADTVFEVRIANTGTKAETDVKLTCTLPPQLKLKNVNGPMRYEVVGNEIVFQPMPRLAPRADALLKITTTGIGKGDARFKATLSSSSLSEPLTKVEVTKVYGD